MPPKKVPKLDGQGQRKRSSLFNAESAKMNRKNDNTDSTDNTKKRAFPPHFQGLQGVQVWRSGESTRLPPMWPWFDSRTRRHMWVEFVGSLLCTERFSPGTPVSPLLKNQHLT